MDCFGVALLYLARQIGIVVISGTSFAGAFRERGKFSSESGLNPFRIAIRKSVLGREVLLSPNGRLCLGLKP